MNTRELERIRHTRWREALMELYVGLKPRKERCYTLVFGVDLVIDPDRRKEL